MGRKYQRKVASYEKFRRKANTRALYFFGRQTPIAKNDKVHIAQLRASRLSKPKPKRKKKKR